MSVFDERENFLSEAIESVVLQTFTDLEFVIVDDGSTSDTTRACLERWRAADSRIRIYIREHRGLTKALNFGLQQCRSELIARHDSDDWSDPTRLTRQVAFLRDNPKVSILGTQVLFHMENGQVLWGSNFPERHEDICEGFKQRNPFCHGSIMYRRDVVYQAGGYRDAMPCSQDYDLFWRLSESARAENLRDTLYHLRRSGGSVSATRVMEQMRVTLLTRILARQRREGGERFEDAEVEAARAVSVLNVEQLRDRKRADNLLLAGSFGKGANELLRLVKGYPFSAAAYMALLRGLLFVMIPPARRLLFRG